MPAYTASICTQTTRPSIGCCPCGGRQKIAYAEHGNWGFVGFNATGPPFYSTWTIERTNTNGPGEPYGYGHTKETFTVLDPYGDCGATAYELVFSSGSAFELPAYTPATVNTATEITWQTQSYTVTITLGGEYPGIDYAAELSSVASCSLDTMPWNTYIRVGSSQSYANSGDLSCGWWGADYPTNNTCEKRANYVFESYCWNYDPWPHIPFQVQGGYTYCYFTKYRFTHCSPMCITHLNPYYVPTAELTASSCETVGGYEVVGSEPQMPSAVPGSSYWKELSDGFRIFAMERTGSSVPPDCCYPAP